MELRGSKVLIVGDDNYNFVLIKSLINNAFSEIIVLSSHSEKQALEIIESEDIDVILIDIPMSKMDGFELCKRIKDDHKLSYISVGIVTSINDLKVNRIKALEHGAETLLLKPIDEIDFIAQILALLKIRVKNIIKRDEKQELMDSIKSDHSLIEAIFDSIPGFLYVYDENGKLVKWNKKHELMTGYTSEELSHMTIDKWFDPVDLIKVNTAVKKVFDEGYGEVEANLILKNSEKIITRLSGAPLLLKNHKYFAGIGLDIAEEKRIEDELKQSEDLYKSLFEYSGLAIGFYKPDGTVISFNQLASQNLGVNIGDYDGKSIYEIFPKASADFYMGRISKAISAESAEEYIDFVSLKPGDKWFSSTFTKIMDERDVVIGVQIISKDITQSIKMENDLKASEKMYRLITENGNDVVTIYNISKNIHTYISPSVQKMRGFTPEEVRIMKFEDAIDPELIEFTINTLNKNMDDFLHNPQSSNNYRYETRQSCKNGQYVWVEISSIYQYNDESELQTVNSLRNIEERKAAEERLSESEEKYRLIAENVSDVISVYNITKNKFIYISPSIMSLRGFTVEEAMNERLEDGRLPEERAILKKNLAENVKEFKNNTSESKLIVSQEQTICKNGERIWVELSIRFHLNAEGDILSTALIRNIEERKAAEEKLMHLSYYDQLTDLYNRRFYEEELMRLDTERNLPIALIMADVNGLKLTNDAFGHHAGDQMLRDIAEIFKKVCRSDEIISRIGGDEFVILLPKCNDTQAKLLIERLNKAISKDKKTNALLSISIGYAVKESVLTKMDAVFKEAEDDMYRHKLAENLSMRSKNIDLIMNSLFEKSNRERLHSDRVSEICEKIAFNMNISQEGIKQIKIAAVLHDIGKIGISDTILNKKGKLDMFEWEEMRKHSEIGYRILSTVSEFSEIAEYVLSHQERWDGKGYPYNLKGEEIPIQARIIAIADAFDAMTEKRSYRDAMSETEAVVEIKKYAGTQLDPEIARIFVEKVMKLAW